MQGVGPTAPATGVVIAVCPLIEAVLVEARISHHGGMRTVAEPPRVTIQIRRASGPGAAPLNASEAVALVDAAERPGEVEQLVIDRIAYGGRAIVATISIMGTRTCAVIVIIIIAIHVLWMVMIAVMCLTITVVSIALLGFAALRSFRLTGLMFTLLAFTIHTIALAVLFLFSCAILTDTLTRLLSL